MSMAAAVHGRSGSGTALQNQNVAAMICARCCKAQAYLGRWAEILRPLMSREGLSYQVL